MLLYAFGYAFGDHQQYAFGDLYGYAFGGNQRSVVSNPPAN